MQTFLNLLNFGIIILQIYLQKDIVLQIAESEYSRIRLAIATVAVFGLDMLILRFFPRLSPFAMALWMLLLIASYFIIFRQPIVKSCIMGIGQMVLIICVEYFVQFILALLGSRIQELLYKNYFGIKLVSLVLLLVFNLSMPKVKIYLQKLLPLHEGAASHNHWALYLIYLVLYTLPNIMHYETNIRMQASRLDIYNLALFITFFCYNAFYMRNLGKMANLSQQLQVQHLYSGTLEKSIAELRGFKHDFANILNVIHGYVRMGQMEPLEVYMSQLNREFLKINTTDIINTQLQEVPLFYGVVLSKLPLAELGGITFDVSIQSTLELKYCDQLDLSRMVGVLLDNALEAAAQTSPKRVELEVVSENGMSQISIRNTYTGNVDLELIKREGYSSKEGHSGLGLAQLETILQKYHRRGYALSLQTSIDDGMFCQVLNG